MFKAVTPRFRTGALVVLALVLPSCDSDTTIITPPGNEPAAVTIAPQSLTLGFIGATGQLTATVTSSAGTPISGTSVQWTSLQSAVATVSASGLVTAAGEGTANIVAQVLNLSDTVTVTVARVATSVDVAPDTVLLTTVGQTAALTATVRDGGGQAMTGQQVTWTSSATEAATVGNTGTVTAVADGVATITATSGNASGQAQVRVATGPATVNVTPDTVAFNSLGGSAQLSAVVRDAAGDTLTAALVWSSGNSQVATVTQAGVVTPTGSGTTTIAATAGGASGTSVVVVTQVAASLVVTPDSVVSGVGGTVAHTASVKDADGFDIQNAMVSWASTDTAVARVDSTGLTTAVAAGTARIVATSGALSDSAVVVVTNVTVSNVDLTPASALLDVGATFTLTVQATDPGGNIVTPPPGEWASSDSAVATVDATGRVTGVSQGRAWVSVAYGSATDSTLFTVTPDIVPEPGPFNIDMRIVGVSNPITTPSPAQVAALKAAEARWESAISGDLAFARPNVAEGACGVAHPAVSEQVDDLLLFIEVTDIDGAGRFLSQVTQCVVRTSNGLPVVAALKLDIRDLLALEASGDLEDAILREFGHALGIGTAPPWDLLAVGAGTSDPYFPGAMASAEFLAAGFTSANPVPLETEFGFGTRDRRWRESVLGSELMTGFLDSGVKNPLSRITLGAMADMGYQVDMTAADPFSAAAQFRMTPVKVRLGSEWTGPLFRIGADGRTVPIGR